MESGLIPEILKITELKLQQVCPDFMSIMMAMNYEAYPQIKEGK